MITHVNNNQGPGFQNTNISGVCKYASNDYGASWATTAAITADLATLFPNPINGDLALLYNTTGTVAKLYGYANNSWVQV